MNEFVTIFLKKLKLFSRINYIFGYCKKKHERVYHMDSLVLFFCFCNKSKSNSQAHIFKYQ